MEVLGYVVLALVVVFIAARVMKNRKGGDGKPSNSGSDVEEN